MASALDARPGARGQPRHPHLGRNRRPDARPHSGDRLLGDDAEPRHAFGFSGHGFQLGPLVGEIIAELVTQGRSASPLAPFAIDRFVGGRTASARDVGVEH
jgi:glycine/D-amino acid oxidase-like deaminating enzyme